MTQGPRVEHGIAWLRQGAIATPEGVDVAGGDREALDKLALQFVAVFGGHDGEIVLQTILDATLFRPPVNHTLPGDEYLRFAQLREGENSAAALILFYLDHAAKLARTKTHGRSDPDPGAFTGRPSFYDGLDGDADRRDTGPNFGIR